MKAWVARDKDGDMYIFWNVKPYKDVVSESWYTNEWIHSDCLDNYSLFGGIAEDLDPQWEDEEPIELNVNITKAK